jgi:hypothetical protein
MKTIDDRWLDFRAGCIAPDSTPTQLREMRIAFYGGFKAMLDANMELAMLPELVAVMLLEQLHIEARHFGASL